jgi:hypothetical protein
MTPRSLALAVALGLLAGAPPLLAQTAPAPSAVDQARTHFARGAELFKEGNYRAALVEFKRANEIAPSYRIHYNLGQAHAELHDHVNALREFEQYLGEGGAEIAADRRAEVEADVRKLRSRVAYVTVKTDVEGQLVVDDVVVATTPRREPVILNAGSHRISVSKGGTVVATRSIEVAGGDTPTVELKGEPVAPPPPVRDRAPARVEQGLGAGFWIGLASTGALAVGATVTGIFALDAKSQYSDRLNAYPVSRADVDAARDRTKRLALVTDVLGGAAVLVGVGTVYLLVTGKSGAASPSAPNVGVVVGPGMLGVQGRF